jgi:hypothetical protein
VAERELPEVLEEAMAAFWTIVQPVCGTLPQWYQSAMQKGLEASAAAVERLVAARVRAQTAAVAEQIMFLVSDYGMACVIAEEEDTKTARDNEEALYEEISALVRVPSAGPTDRAELRADNASPQGTVTAGARPTPHQPRAGSALSARHNAPDEPGRSSAEQFTPAPDQPEEKPND